jgi:hypothetical protein
MVYRQNLSWATLIGVAAIAPLVVMAQPASADTVRGGGTFLLEGRSAVGITSISYQYGSESNRTLVLMLEDGRSVTLGGRLLEGQNSRLQVESSGNADASGILSITYAEANLDSISGRGLLDGQHYSLEFSRDRSSSSSDGSLGDGSLGDGSLGDSDAIKPLNLVQQGSGLYKIGDRQFDIIRASIAIRGSNKAEIAFRLSDDRLMQLTGEVTSQDAYNIVIRLVSFGQADASGTANVARDQGSSIKSIVVDGKVEGQTLLADFYR